MPWIFFVNDEKNEAGFVFAVIYERTGFFAAANTLHDICHIIGDHVLIPGGLDMARKKIIGTAVAVFNEQNEDREILDNIAEMDPIEAEAKANVLPIQISGKIRQLEAQGYKVEKVDSCKKEVLAMLYENIKVCISMERYQVADKIYEIIQNIDKLLN